MLVGQSFSLRSNVQLKRVLSFVIVR